ncbi:PIH1 domain-containing protein 1-like isoform X1 [Harmonia axyridis]|uniref:PIH1 domain-containing protein 1-like isoform X1 n=1 Tax=Harmonia axyridis TaxID=115357 RepID=UPI001E2771EF|nr:PIH1 domain-containing protein 1-like isoform X1 [Harmonia axyridis]
MSNSVFLEVDSSIKENQLKLVTDETEQDFQKFLSEKESEFPSKYIQPFPGFCVKTKDSLGDKFFLNICHNEAIPTPPTDITNLRAEDVLEKDITEFRVPMSIGTVRPEKDTKGLECKACDIVINSLFYKKIEYDSNWKNFVLTIVFEALKEKYQIDCIEEDKIILSNRRHLGNIQKHKIQDRDMAKEMGLDYKDLNNLKEKTPKIQMLSSAHFEAKVPKYRLYKKTFKQNCLIGEFIFPDVISGNELKLDLGEDRIIIECEQKNYLLDIFLPVIVSPYKSSSTFDKATKIITIIMPLVGG